MIQVSAIVVAVTGAAMILISLVFFSLDVVVLSNICNGGANCPINTHPFFIPFWAYDLLLLAGTVLLTSSLLLLLMRKHIQTREESKAGAIPADGVLRTLEN